MDCYNGVREKVVIVINTERMQYWPARTSVFFMVAPARWRTVV